MSLRKIYNLVNKMIGGVDEYTHYGITNDGLKLEIKSMFDLAMMSETISPSNKYIIDQFNIIPYFKDITNQARIKGKILDYLRYQLKKTDKDIIIFKDSFDKLDAKMLMATLIGKIYISDDKNNNMEKLMKIFFEENKVFMDYLKTLSPYGEGLSLELEKPLFKNELGLEQGEHAYEKNEMSEQIIKNNKETIFDLIIKNI